MESFIRNRLLLLGVLSIKLHLSAAAESSSDIGWFVPQKDGSAEWMTLQDYEEFKSQHAFNSLTNDFGIKYYLFTPKNPDAEQQVFEEESSLSKSYFDKNLPTRFIIHGWLNGRLSPVNVLIRTALLKTGDYNVFSVDWSERSALLAYPAARGSVPGVGAQVARFVDFLVNKGNMKFETLHLIGHSLGAHVAGYVGKHVQSGKISQIIGLDPALPLFSLRHPEMRLTTTDAVYVESIQTCGNYLGFLEPIGHAAFYPNGGKAQPGCGWDLAGGCAHGRAYEYYAESIEFNDFVCTKCGSFKDATRKLCGGEIVKDIRMGSPKNHEVAKGSFYVPVNEKTPFGQGFQTGFSALGLISHVNEINRECSGAVNKLISIDLRSARTYLNMGGFFSLATINLENLSQFFFQAATKVFQDASELTEFFSKAKSFQRDMSVLNKQSYNHFEKREWKDGLAALSDALNIETEITRTIKSVISACNDNKSNSTSVFLEKQLENEQTILAHIKSLKKMTTDSSLYSDFIYDKEL